MRALIFLAVLGAAVNTAPAGATLFVDPAGDDGDDCLSPATACLTIQAAIHKAPDGETIQVALGTYAEQVVISNRESLRLQGAPGAAIVDPGLPLGDAVFHIQASRLIRLEDLAISGNPAGVEAVRIFDTAVVEGNGGTDLVCANGSMVRGELGGVGKVSCRRAQ